MIACINRKLRKLALWYVRGDVSLAYDTGYLHGEADVVAHVQQAAYAEGYAAGYQDALPCDD